ncbi:MAG: biotin/lipoyl-binding protein, partial [Anaerolineae bacterium]
MRKVIPFVILLLIVAAGAGAWWYLRGHPEALTQLLTELEIQPVQPIEGLSASGFIEAEEVITTAEVGGRIERIAADEGDEVKRGDVLVELDKTLLMAQMRQAEAAVEVAEAALAQVKAGARPEDIHRAEAALVQAEAVRDGDYQAWLDAQAVLNNPQELEARI